MSSRVPQTGLEHLGVEVGTGDYSVPRSLLPASQNVRTVITVPGGVISQLALIDAAISVVAKRSLSEASWQAMPSDTVELH